MEEDKPNVDTDKKWSILDELKLLNAVDNCGYGNWSNISSKVPPYTPMDCKQHYHDRFVFDVVRRPALCSNNCKIQVDPMKEYSFNSSSISDMNEYLRELAKDDTAKPQYSGVNSGGPKSNSNKLCNYMITLPYIGYNRIRSDFDIEYDNGAENILKLIGENHFHNAEMDDEDSHLFQELEFTLYQSYNERLRQRHVRKIVIKDHCLIDRRKTFNMLQRLDVGFGKTTLKALIPLLRFFKGPEFDFLVEKLKYQNELRLKMSLLMEYRRNGLKYLNDINIYKKLKNKRLKYDVELACLRMNSAETKSSGPFLNKKPTAPLALGHLPGYNLLNEDEKKLCSNHRIVPETFLSFKEVLVAECQKHQGLRLAQARNLIKIDVNKTRKIYDYLISLNLIWPPEF